MTDLPESNLTSMEQSGVARPARYVGNTNDLVALGAAATGLTVCGYMSSGGLFCLMPLLLGIAGLSLAKSAEDPKRARTLSLVGLTTGGCLILFFLAVLACNLLYVGFFSLFMTTAVQSGQFR